MREQFANLPKAIKRHLLIRFGLGFVAIILFAVLLIFERDFILSLPCLVLAVYLLASGGLLLYNNLKGNVICVQGVCERIEKGVLRKRSKAVYLSSNVGQVKLVTHRVLRKIAVGDTVNVYLRKNASVYEREGTFTVCEYIALEKTALDQSEKNC